MNTILKLLSYLGLGLTVLPSILVFSGMMEGGSHYTIMIVGMVLWFATAIFWVKPDKHQG